ncbi:MAG: quinohemoprotein amine dehydrogenase maturation protein [Alphaproteobacteria bacterium]|nr:quinohemoprotein amine dehydrogenase maturation protein [Alphaproteobacteria bacterium]MDP6517410.1 quinohemoprotein amine dehydrogenase maturation protein [Alphaproteobacteria bacterium]
MSALTLVPHNLHRVAVDGRRMMFHIPTSGLFALDEVSGDILDLFDDLPSVTTDDVRRRFDGRHPADAVVVALEELITLDVVSDGRAAWPGRKPVKIENFPLSTIVLNTNTGCNLSCGYCYKEDLETPARGDKMSFETARQGVELLLAEGAQRGRFNIVFFGGEPLSNMALIREVVAYAEGRAAELSKQVDFTLTTNATLLDAALIDWFDDHRFGLTVSMDGPKAIHDRNRRTVGGKGTYDTVAAKVGLLLSRYRSRPVGARVTLTAGVTDVATIWDHLINELGFHEVGFSPVTSGEADPFKLNGDDLAELFANMKALAERYTDAAIAGRNIGFSNMHQLMTDLSEGMSKALPCGAGLGLLAVDTRGGLNLCHRFTGSDVPLFGTVAEGIAKDRLGQFLESRLDRAGETCDTCRIRNLCSGGCYHESYARYHDPHHPTYHYCDLMRDWVDYGIAAYARIRARNPAFFTDHLEPRRAMK